MKKYIGFLVMYLVNGLLIWLANTLYPNNFVLGSASNSTWGAILLVGFLWTLLILLIQPILNKFKVNLAKGVQMFGVYLAANFVILWVIARLGPVFGFGVSNFVWVFGLAITANVIQVGVWMLLSKFKLAKM